MGALPIEKSVKAYKQSALFILFESYRERQGAFFPLEIHLVNTAKVHKIECGAPQKEQRVKIICSGRFCNAIYMTDAVSHAELAYAQKDAVVIRGISEIIRMVCNATIPAKSFLFVFFLDRFYRKHSSSPVKT